MAVLGLSLVFTWHLRPFVVSGPSMAETLVGECHQLTCRDCGHRFRCDTEPEMPGKRAVCPNCGGDGGRIDTAPHLAADGVLVDRSAFLVRSPRRWDLAAFRGVDHGSQVYVKRVVGLPGEAVEIRHGDVYADGAIQRKNLAQLRALAVLVNDSRQAPATAASRWLPDAADSGWRQASSRFWRAGTKAKSGEQTIDWLTYHHQRGRSGVAEAADEAPISDDGGYNQTSPVIASYLVRDLMVRCRMRVVDSPSMTWLLTDGTSQFLVELAFSQAGLTVMQDGRWIGTASLPDPKNPEDVLCELALCDEQVLFGLDGQEVVRLAYQCPDVPFHPTSRPLAVGARADGLEMWDLVVLRDIFYRPIPNKGGSAGQDPLADDEYFVLGDNSSASQDSRHWPRPGVTTADLVGKPWLAYPSGVRGRLPGGQFQVPDWSRFRYIH